MRLGTTAAVAALIMVCSWIPASSGQPKPGDPMMIVDNQRDGPLAQQSLGATLVHWIVEGKDEQRDKLLREVESHPHLVDGRPTIWVLFRGCGDYFERRGDWDAQLVAIRKWEADRAGDVVPRLMEAQYWVTYGQYARGGDFARNVPPKAWDVMRERMHKARAVLEEIREPGAGKPMWYSLMLTVALFEDWPREDVLTMFNKALEVDPYFTGTYLQAAYAFAPRWGGDLDAYAAFVDGAVAKTRPREGETYYARLYWQLSGIEWNRDPFADLGIPWAKMKAGFEDLMKRYPDSQWNLHNFASFACRAGDGNTYNALRPRLQVGRRAFFQGAWRDAYTIEFCDEQFAKRT